MIYIKTEERQEDSYFTYRGKLIEPGEEVVEDLHKFLGGAPAGQGWKGGVAISGAEIRFAVLPVKPAMSANSMLTFS